MTRLEKVVNGITEIRKKNNLKPYNNNELNYAMVYAYDFYKKNYKKELFGFSYKFDGYDLLIKSSGADDSELSSDDMFYLTSFIYVIKDMDELDLYASAVGILRIKNV